MRILVTGGAGFVGSALAECLVQEGHSVVVVDNFNEYYDVRLKRARQETFLKNSVVVEGDITKQEVLEDLFLQYTFDLVAHVAAQAGVRYSVEAPHVYLETNVRGTQALLETMKTHDVKRMVYASTSSVYGMDTPVPFLESAAADRPVSIYAATKRAGELIAHTYFSLYGIETTCLRFFTVYGPWSRPDMAMLKFAEQIRMGEPIDVYNNGDLRRDFTYIDDIVNGFVAAINTPLGYEIINLGNGEPIELRDFIVALEESLGTKAKQNLLPMQPGDMYETYADTNKAKNLLNFEANTDFRDGIAKFVEWYRLYY